MKGLKLAGFLLISAFFLAMFVVLIAGTFTPSEFKGSASGEIMAPPTKVWSVLTNIQGIPGRRPRTKQVEIREPNAQGLPVWKETTTTGGFIVFEVLERTPPKVLQVAVKESSFEMKGTWKYTLTPRDGHTWLTIEENSTIESLPLRLALSFTKQDKSTQTEFENLKKAVENPTAPKPDAR